MHTYSTSRAFKVFETFCYLKTLSPSGKLHNRFRTKHQFYKYLSDHCHLTVNSLYNRLEWLKEWNLISIDKYGHITLESWQQVAKDYYVQADEFYEIEITEQTKRLEYVFRVMVLAENKSRQAWSFAKFVSNNRVLPYIKQLLPGEELLQDMTALAAYLQKYKEWAFMNRSDSYDFLHSLRPDFNITVYGIAKIFDFSDTRSSCYLKRLLKTKGLIQVIKRKLESKVCTRHAHNVLSGEIVPTNFIWDSEKKVRIWQQCDEILIRKNLFL